MHKGIRPYTRGQIAAFLLELENSEKDHKIILTKSQSWLVDKLKEEFGYEIQTLRNKFSDPSVKYNLDPICLFNSNQDKKPVLTRLKIAGSFQKSDWILLKIRGLVDNQAEKNPEFLRKKWIKNWGGTFEQSYLHLNFKFLKIFSGRDNLRWGPASSDGLLFSGQSPALDQIRLETQFWYFKFFSFTSILDKMYVSDSVSRTGINRYISAHGLSFKHPKGVEFSFSEVVIYGGAKRNLEFYYLVPLLPYYTKQLNQKVDDNILWSLALDLSFWKGKEFYAEFLIDDFQHDFKDEPNQTGYLIGTNLSNPFGLDRTFLNFEYSRLRFWLYGATVPWNRFSFHEKGLGSVLGPDADLIRGTFSYHLTKEFSLHSSASYKRKGEGEIAIPYPAPLPEISKFPSGIVEKTTSFEILGIFQPNSKFKVDLGLQLSTRKNIENIPDRNENKIFSFKMFLCISKHAHMKFPSLQHFSLPQSDIDIR